MADEQVKPEIPDPLRVIMLIRDFAQTGEKLTEEEIKSFIFHKEEKKC